MKKLSRGSLTSFGWLGTILILTGLCLALPGTTTPALAADFDTADLASKIIWFDGERTRAAFLPESVLQGADPESLPIAASAASMLRQQLEMARGSSRGPSKHSLGCERAAHDSASLAGRSSLAESFPERLGRRGTTLIGRVVAVVPGWSAWRLRPESMLYIDIEEVLYSTPGLTSSRWPVAGDRISLALPEASLEIDQTLLCSKNGRAPFTPGVGDRILFDGGSQDQVPDYFVGTLHRIEDGRVSDSLDAKALPMAEVEALLLAKQERGQ